MATWNNFFRAYARTGALTLTKYFQFWPSFHGFRYSRAERYNAVFTATAIYRLDQLCVALSTIEFFCFLGHKRGGKGRAQWKKFFALTREWGIIVSGLSTHFTVRSSFSLLSFWAIIHLPAGYMAIINFRFCRIVRSWSNFYVSRSFHFIHSTIWIHRCSRIRCFERNLTYGALCHNRWPQRGVSVYRTSLETETHFCSANRYKVLPKTHIQTCRRMIFTTFQQCRIDFCHVSGLGSLVVESWIRSQRYPVFLYPIHGGGDVPRFIRQTLHEWIGYPEAIEDCSVWNFVAPSASRGCGFSWSRLLTDMQKLSAYRWFLPQRQCPLEKKVSRLRANHVPRQAGLVVLCGSPIHSQYNLKTNSNKAMFFYRALGVHVSVSLFEVPITIISSEARICYRAFWLYVCHQVCPRTQLESSRVRLEFVIEHSGYGLVSRSVPGHNLNQLGWG